MRYLIIGAVLLAFGSSILAADANVTPETWIANAAAAYKEALETSDRNHQIERFRTAETCFSQAIAAAFDSTNGELSVDAELYVNLGNAALGAQRLGPAVVAYRRALLVDPNHNRAKQNLEHARSLLPEWVPKPDNEISMGSFFDGMQRVVAADWHVIASVAFLLTAIFTVAYLRFHMRGMKTASIAFSVLWLVAFVGGFARTEVPEPVVVVTVPETVARSADSSQAPPRFANPLPSGTELRVLEDRGDWLRVKLSDGREVWVTASAIESV
ncbi:MAG: hypothetical protein AAGD07_16585 [Planctomycetota bacterium]